MKIIRLNKNQKKYIICLTLPRYRKVAMSADIIPCLTHNEKVQYKVKLFGTKNVTHGNAVRYMNNFDINSNIQKFEWLRQVTRIASPSIESDYIKSFFKNRNYYKQANLAGNFKSRLPQAGITGYYLASNIFHARLFGGIKLLSRREAIKYMYPLAVQIQNSYSTWQEYFLSYYVGYAFGHDNVDLKTVYDQYCSYVSFVFTNNLPNWNTKL